MVSLMHTKYEIGTKYEIVFPVIIHTCICVARIACVFCVDIYMYSFIKNCEHRG